MAAFAKQKEACLSQVDLSKKGSIDEHITELIKFINAKEDYFTTSSCSGRISVFSELTDQRKKHCEWLYVSHDTAREDDILDSLNGYQGNASLKFEPFVLHIQCKDLHAGQQMLKAALVSGFKNSGIVLGKKGHVITAVRSTQNLEVPLINDGQLMVSEKFVNLENLSILDLALSGLKEINTRSKVLTAYLFMTIEEGERYITFLVNIANRKLKENETRIDRFFFNIKDILNENRKNRDDYSGGSKGTGYTKTSQDAHGQVCSKDGGENDQQQQSNSLETNTNDDIQDCLVSFYGSVS